MMTSYALRIRSQAKMQMVGQALSPLCVSGFLLGLDGDLGAGKTTFTKFLLSALGGDIVQVGSPTYTLCLEYQLPSGLTLEHWDLYRLAGAPEELFEAVPQGSFRIVEWVERSAELIEECDLHVKIRVEDNDDRTFIFSGKALEHSQYLLSKLSHEFFGE